MRDFTIAVVILSSFFLINISFAAYEISDGSVKALYHLSDEVDSSGNSNTLTNTNSVTFGSGHLEDAATFNGSTNKLTRSSLTGIPSGSGSWSMGAWVKTSNTDSSDFKAIMCFGTAATRQQACIYRQNSDKDMYFAGYGDDIDTNLTIPTSSTWVFLVSTFDGTTVKNYMNASSGASKAIALNITGTAFSMGTSLPNDRWWPGSVDEAFILNGKVLSQTEITDLFNAGAGQEICVTEDCAEPAPSSTTSTAMTDYEIFVSYQLIVTIIIIIGIGTYKLLA